MSYELPVHHDIVFPQFRNANEGPGARRATSPTLSK